MIAEEIFRTSLKWRWVLGATVVISPTTINTKSKKLWGSGRRDYRDTWTSVPGSDSPGCRKRCSGLTGETRRGDDEGTVLGVVGGSTRSLDGRNSFTTRTIESVFFGLPVSNCGGLRTMCLRFFVISTGSVKPSGTSSPGKLG